MSLRNQITGSTSLCSLNAGNSNVNLCLLQLLTGEEFLVQDAGSMSLSSWVASLRSRDRNKSSWIQNLQSVEPDSKKEGVRLKFSAGISCRFLAEAWDDYVQGESLRGRRERSSSGAESRREMGKVGEQITIKMLSTLHLHHISTSLILSWRQS